MKSESMTPGPEKHASVTPLLFVGATPSPRAVQVTTAQAAMKVMSQGKIAVLPAGAWDEARVVVETLSGSKQKAATAVRLAQRVGPGPWDPISD